MMRRAPKSDTEVLAEMAAAGLDREALFEKRTVTLLGGFYERVIDVPAYVGGYQYGVFGPKRKYFGLQVPASTRVLDARLTASPRGSWRERDADAFEVLLEGENVWRYVTEYPNGYA